MEERKSLVKVFELLDQAIPEASNISELFSYINQFEVCFTELQLRDPIYLGKRKFCDSNYSQR